VRVADQRLRLGLGIAIAVCGPGYDLALELPPPAPYAPAIPAASDASQVMRALGMSIDVICALLRPQRHALLRRTPGHTHHNRSYSRVYPCMFAASKEAALRWPSGRGVNKNETHVV
jgi:hypothetical protein